MSRKEQLKKWLWYFSIPAACVLLYKMYDNASGALDLIGRFFGILAPFLGGFLLAFLLYGPSHWLEVRFLGLKSAKWQKWARPVSMLITYIGFLGLLVLLFSLIIPILIDSLSDLADTLPKRLADAQGKLDEWVSPGGPLGGLNLDEALPNIFNGLSTAIEGLFSTKNVLTAIKGVGNVASSLIDVVIAFVVSIYMLSGHESLMHAVRNFAGLFLRRRTLANLRHYTRRSGQIFSKYIYGALIDALLVGVTSSIGLLIFRVPYAILLGMLLGMMNLIPYFGALLGGVAVAFIALLTNGFPVALGVAAFILVIQQIDANILQPRIIADSMGLRPIYVLPGITFFGGLFGFWGILLGPPLMGVIQMVVRDIYARRKKEAARAREKAKAEENAAKIDDIV